MSAFEEKQVRPVDRPVRCTITTHEARQIGDPQPYWGSTVPLIAGTNTPNPATGRGTA